MPERRLFHDTLSTSSPFTSAWCMRAVEARYMLERFAAGRGELVEPYVAGGLVYRRLMQHRASLRTAMHTTATSLNRAGQPPGLQPNSRRHKPRSRRQLLHSISLMTETGHGEVKVKASHGEVKVKARHGEVKVKARHGEVKVKARQGEVKVKARQASRRGMAPSTAGFLVMGENVVHSKNFQPQKLRFNSVDSVTFNANLSGVSAAAETRVDTSKTFQHVEPLLGAKSAQKVQDHCAPEPSAHGEECGLMSAARSETVQSECCRQDRQSRQVPGLGQSVSHPVKQSRQVPGLGQSVSHPVKQSRQVLPGTRADAVNGETVLLKQKGVDGHNSSEEIPCRGQRPTRSSVLKAGEGVAKKGVTLPPIDQRGGKGRGEDPVRANLASHRGPPLSLPQITEEAEPVAAAGESSRMNELRATADAPKPSHCFVSDGDAPKPSHCFVSDGDAPKPSHCFVSDGGAPKPSHCSVRDGDVRGWSLRGPEEHSNALASAEIEAPPRTETAGQAVNSLPVSLNAQQTEGEGGRQPLPDPESSEASLQALEWRIRQFHLTHGLHSPRPLNLKLPKLRRFTSTTQDGMGEPRPGGRVWIKRRLCHIANSKVKVSGHQHVRHHIVPHLPYFPSLQKKECFP